MPTVAYLLVIDRLGIITIGSGGEDDIAFDDDTGPHALLYGRFDDIADAVESLFLGSAGACVAQQCVFGDLIGSKWDGTKNETPNVVLLRTFLDGVEDHRIDVRDFVYIKTPSGIACPLSQEGLGPRILEELDELSEKDEEECAPDVTVDRAALRKAVPPLEGAPLLPGERIRGEFLWGYHSTAPTGHAPWADFAFPRDVEVPEGTSITSGRFAEDGARPDAREAVALFMLRQLSPQFTGKVGELAGFLATASDFELLERLPEGPIDDATAEAGTKAVHAYLDQHESEIEEALHDGASEAGFHASASFEDVVRSFEKDDFRIVFPLGDPRKT